MAKTKNLTKTKGSEQTTTAQSGAGSTIAGKYTVKSLVTLPLWKWADREPKAMRIETPIVLGKAVDTRARRGRDDSNEVEGVQMAPAHICNVINLETGEMCQIIVGAVLKGTLEDTYPNEGYVGKCFVIEQHKIEQKRYKGYQVAEIEDPSKDG